jgi:hypothetical protein
MQVVMLPGVRNIQVIGLLLLSAAAFYLPVLAQRDGFSETNRSKLQLVLIRSSVVPEEGAKQENLTIRIVNVGDVAISVPPPTRLCGDSSNGFVMVYTKVLWPSNYFEVGHGCDVYRVKRADVLADAMKWKMLTPGDVYDMLVPITAVGLDPNYEYELHAKYYAPTLTTAELSTLAEHGINVVQQNAESDPIIVEPKND